MTINQTLTRNGPYSVEYYAWRHLPYSTFQALDVIVTLFDLLNRIPSEVSEPHVARMKLGFFQSDIHRARTGHANHPHVQALSTLLQRHPIDLTPFNEICIAIETEIDRVQSIDDKDFNRFCKRKRGSLLLLCGEIIKHSPLTQEEITQLNNLGIFIERTHLSDIKASNPEKIHLLSLKDIDHTEYNQATQAFFKGSSLPCALKPMMVLALLYKAQTSHPLTLLTLSLYYRIKGY